MYAHRVCSSSKVHTKEPESSLRTVRARYIRPACSTAAHGATRPRRKPDRSAALPRRYCSADAFFCVKEVDLAITADMGTLQRLPRIVGAGAMPTLYIPSMTVTACMRMRATCQAFLAR
jgi:hypothetical protein